MMIYVDIPCVYIYIYPTEYRGITSQNGMYSGDLTEN